MTIEELVNKIRDEGIQVLSNKAVRDAFGYRKLDESVCKTIRYELESKQEIAFGGTLTPDQNGYVLLYDNRKDSNIRKLLELAVSVKSGQEFQQYGSNRADEKLQRAAEAAFHE